MPDALVVDVFILTMTNVIFQSRVRSIRTFIDREWICFSRVGFENIVLTRSNFKLIKSQIKFISSIDSFVL